MNKKNKPVRKNQTSVGSNQLSITRVYASPVEDVWNAWVDPKQVGQWWGPRGFTLTTKRKNVKTGGDWLYTMHGPDGVDYPNHTQFLEVEKHKRLVYDHGGFEDRPPMFRVTVLFSEINGSTKMEMTMTFPKVEAAIEAKKFIKKAGGEATWDRLAEFLEMNSNQKDVFIINRTFEIDRETLFDVWTQPDHIMNWMAPTGFTGKYIRADIRPGGESFYSMTGHGITMYGKARYLEIKKPELLVYTQAFVDQNEKISRHPMAPTWPETMKTTVTFHEEGPDQTRISLCWEIVGEATPEERETFRLGKPGMTQGWGGSFDKLDDYLKKIQTT